MVCPVFGWFVGIFWVVRLVCVWFVSGLAGLWWFVDGLGGLWMICVVWGWFRVLQLTLLKIYQATKLKTAVKI